VSGRLTAAGMLWMIVAAGDGGLDLHAKQGREIYRRGTAVGSATLGVDGVALPATSLPCANCHGLWGEGVREGGLAPPPLSWHRLTTEAVSPVTGRRRPPYTERTLRRAIAEGLDPAGNRLHPWMPRFDLPAAQMADLIAYLRRLGDENDTDPGVSATKIRIGAALPLSGPLEPVGRSLEMTLRAAFADASGSGGIYGRSLELVVADSRGDPGGLEEATRKLIFVEGVFALAASFAPAGSAATDRLLQTEQVPLVGPATLSPHVQDAPNPYVFYLLPSLYDQVRVLVDHVAARGGAQRSRLAALYSGNAFDLDALEGLRAQARLHGLAIVAEERYAPDSPAAGRVIADLLARQPDYVLFLGGGDGLASLARQLEGVPVPPVLLSCVALSGGGAQLLGPRMAARTLFAAPTAPPGSAHALAILGRAEAPRGNLGFRATAYAAAQVLAQGLRACGHRLSRDGLVRELERLRDFDTGVLPPLSFAPGRRVGSAGAVILAVDGTSGGLVPVSAWSPPQEARRP
jgi:ABC-type branched-subunit amino acid transport system substrate-binding protein